MRALIYFKWPEYGAFDIIETNLWLNISNVSLVELYNKRAEVFALESLNSMDKPLIGKLSFVEKIVDISTDNIQADNGGIRTSNAVPKDERHDLIPTLFLRELAKHYGKSTEPIGKYPERNWERGMKWSICVASFSRHWYSWLSGETIDSESGTHHLISAIWNLITLFIYQIRGIGIDDRVMEKSNGS